ncbi:MAG: BON domain-containing protein [Candidatus Sulfotelmatobacter sp.]
MKKTRLGFALLMALAFAGLLDCSRIPSKSPEVSNSIRKSLDQAGLKDVAVSQDRDKGVVTLAGNVAADGDKAQAESIAKAIAVGQVVADQIAVLPPGAESDSKAVNSDVDKAIEKNLDAALIQNKLKNNVKYDVKNAVVTLSGEVNSESKRSDVQRVASAVPNVRQVVNELQIKNQKASSTR